MKVPNLPKGYISVVPIGYLPFERDTTLTPNMQQSSEISEWFSEKNRYVIAFFKQQKEGFELQFVGDRPFQETIDPLKFMTLAKIGQAMMDYYFEIEAEEE